MTRTYTFTPRLRMLNPGLVKVSILVGLAFGVLLCPTFGERWRRVQTLHAEEGSQPSPAESTISDIADEGEELFAGPPTPADMAPRPIELESGVDGTQVTPGALSLGAATVEDGRLVQDLGDGRKVVYTVDPRIQDTMKSMVESYSPPLASVVVMEPSTGRILAMVDYSSIDELKGEPLSLRAEAPAASIFKLVSSAALLESGKVATDTPICYSGGKSRITQRHLRYDPERDRTCKNLGQALSASANPVYARLTSRYLNATELQRAADRFGFNQTLPFLWPVQTSRARIPSDDLELARSSAGFGHTHLSPLHAAMMASAVGNHGTMMAPVIVDHIETSGEPIYSWKPSVLAHATAPEIAATIAAMMVGTTKDGTAAKYFHKANAQVRKLDVAGKTGSLTGDIAGQRFNFSWFVGFAPAENPEVAVAVMVANDPKWKVKSTYLAREALESYFAGVDAPSPAHTASASDAF
ncbi:MAG: penicillin-binding transpeptidase domain-containing protein [Pseudomonadota bacterium]